MMNYLLLSTNFVFYVAIATALCKVSGLSRKSFIFKASLLTKPSTNNYSSCWSIIALYQKKSSSAKLNIRFRCGT